MRSLQLRIMHLPIFAAVMFAGCATTNTGSKPPFASEYKGANGRVIKIGKCSPADNGWTFRGGELNKCWLAKDFNFTGYHALYIAPAISVAKIPAADERAHELAKENIAIEFARLIGRTGLFTNIVTDEKGSAARTLKLENTIVEYEKGNIHARNWAGFFGAGQPVLLVKGKVSDGQQVVFTYEARRSGIYMGGALSADEDVQLDDIRWIALHLSDFMAAVAGKHQPRH
jgi:hypothetical protein